MRRRITNREFQEWFLYEQIEPFGEKRDDFRAGILWALIANIYRKKDAKTISAMDYPLIKEQKTKQEVAQELHQQFLRFKAQYEMRQKINA